MSACNFSIPISASAESVINKARNAVVSQGGTFNGDTSSGSFKVSVMGSSIKGSYTIANNEMNISIDSKSFLIPCGAIEGFLKKQLS